MRKRLLAFFLAMNMFVGMGCASAFAMMEQNEADIVEDVQADGVLLGLRTEGEYYKTSDKVTRIEYVCPYLVANKWQAPNLIRMVLGPNITEIGANAFESIFIPFNKETFHPKELRLEGVEKIGGGAFVNASSIEKIVLSPNLKVLENGSLCNRKLTSELNFQDTQLEYIGDGALGFTSITEALLPNTLRHIGTDAFYRCPLKKVVLLNGITELGAANITGNDGAVEVHIPQSVTMIADQPLRSILTGHGMHPLKARQSLLL